MYQSHNTGDCGFFNNKDRKDLYASLKAMNLEEEETEDSAWTVEQEELEEEQEPPDE